MMPLAFGLKEPLAAGADPHRQSLGAALQEAFGYPSFQLLMAGYFVCGFQVVFIGVHLPSYLGDRGLAPGVAATALALIGLFNIFGTYAAGVLGQHWPKRLLLSAIYILRSLAIIAFLLVPLSPWSVYIFAAVIGLLWLSTVPADQRAGGPDLRRAIPVDARRLRVPQPPGRLVPRRLARRQAVRQHRQLRHRLVDRGRARRVRGVDQPAGTRKRDSARPACALCGSRVNAMTRARRIGIWLAVAAVLALVFAWYLRPDVVMTLATQIWNCF